MTSDLKQLLQDSAADAPHERHGVGDIVRSAQRNQRRHTNMLVAGTALALALIAGVGYATLGDRGFDDAQPVVGRDQDTVLQRDAQGNLPVDRRAVSGKDYEVITEVKGAEVVDTGWRPDDVSLIARGDRFTLVSGDDGSLTPLDSPTGDAVPAYAGDGHVVWVGGAKPTTMLIQDLASGAEHELPVNVEGVGDLDVSQATDIAIDSGRVWASIPVKGSDKDPLLGKVVASAPLDGSEGFRREVDGTVLQAVVAEGKLAWNADFGAPVVVRDLATGKEQEFGGTGSKDCAQAIVGVAAERVAAEEQCMGSSNGPANNTTVWSLDGGARLVLKDFRATANGLSDTALLVQGAGSTDPTDAWSTYAYVFGTGELLDLGAASRGVDGGAQMWPARASGDRAIFPSPDQDGEMVLVQLK